MKHMPVHVMFLTTPIDQMGERNCWHWSARFAAYGPPFPIRSSWDFRTGLLRPADSAFIFCRSRVFQYEQQSGRKAAGGGHHPAPRGQGVHSIASSQIDVSTHRTPQLSSYHTYLGFRNRLIVSDIKLRTFERTVSTRSVQGAIVFALPERRSLHAPR